MFEFEKIFFMTFDDVAVRLIDVRHHKNLST